MPLAPGVRYTENGSQLAIGDALWATARELGENTLIFTDPASGGIQLYAAVVESGLPSMLAARLKVENRQITELETTVLRRNADDPVMAAFAVNRPIWAREVPANQRVSRQALIDIADTYFEGITQGRGDITPFDATCIRFENGGQMTARTDAAANPVQRMSCQEQFAVSLACSPAEASFLRAVYAGGTDMRVCTLAVMAFALAAAPIAAQQPAVSIDGDDIIVRGCVMRTGAQLPISLSTLVWSRGDILLAGAAAADASAPNPVGTSGIAGRVFYWLEDDDDLAEHIGQLVEIKGEFEDFEKGEIEIERDGEFTEIELDLGGKEEKIRVPTAWLGDIGSDKDQEFEIAGRRIDVEDVRVIGACNSR